MSTLASMTPFQQQFPDVAARETRVVQLLYPQGGLPADTYGFLELYCDDPTCDCRRVLLQVRTEDDPNTILATINYGWETEEFYTKWLHGYRDGARAIRDASLDPLNPQSKLSASLMRLFPAVALSDTAYVARLARHYAMVKQHQREQQSDSR